MLKYSIIVAGGKGNRFKSELPKQFVNLNGMPILMHTIKAFYSYDNSIRIIVVLPEDQFELWKSLCIQYCFEIKHELISGGATRFHSVKNGLSAIRREGLVAIHDGVRPLIDKHTIHNCFKLAENEGNAIPVIAPVDSMRKIKMNGSNEYVNRSEYRLIQTPQVFHSQLIIKAFEQEYSEAFTDDASVLEAMIPECIKLAEGNFRNIKITTLEDLTYAESVLKIRDKQNQ